MTLHEPCYAGVVIVTRVGVIANDIVSGVWWGKETVMSRNLTKFGAALLVFVASTSALAAQFGAEEEARAMLERAVGALKENKEKALDMFTRAKAVSRIVTSMCFARTPQTACSPRIPT